MLYLEDYLEMIENLPMEMRDRFTEMREMDLQVQNAMDSLDEKVKTFFKKCQATQGVKQEWKDEQFNKLKEDYNKALEDADEKVQLANQIYEMVERYLRKLDQELSKFKMELEADNAGITEILERRSLEMDTMPTTLNNHRAEKRKYAPTLGNHLDKRTTTEKVLSSLANEVARESIGTHRGGTTSAAASPAVGASANTTTAPNTLSFTIGPVGTTSNAAIAAAASRAIGATLEMQQGRRTSSLKASYEALARTPELSKDFAFGSGDFRGSGAASQPATPPEPKTQRNKKSSSRAQQQQQQQQQQLQAAAPTVPVIPQETPAVDVTAPVAGDDTTAAATWAYDPNEPRYCICNDVSYGEMVGCDNDDCPIEWFHYGCVGLTQAPKGKWYCPQCMVAMKRRGRK